MSLPPLVEPVEALSDAERRRTARHARLAGFGDWLGSGIESFGDGVPRFVDNVQNFVGQFGQIFTDGRLPSVSSIVASGLLSIWRTFTEDRIVRDAAAEAATVATAAAAAAE